MGESQCPTCGHIVSGFEQEDFEYGLSVLTAKDAEIARLKAIIKKMEDAECDASDSL